MQIVAMYGSTFVLLAAGFDRYLAICHPMKSFRSSRKRVYFTVAAMWIISAFLATPQVRYFSLFFLWYVLFLEEIISLEILI